MTEDVTGPVVRPDFARRRLGTRLRRHRTLLLVLLAVLLVLTGIWLVLFSSVVTVRGVDVTGNTTLSAQQVARVAQPPLGRPLARADLSAVRARVEAIPEVRTVAVSRSWPHTIHVAITERVAVAVVSRGAGLQAVDDSGVLFGSYPTPPSDLPLIRTAPDVDAEVLAEAAKVVQSLRADIAAKVAFVDVETVDKITLRMDGGIRVLWGSADSSKQKAEVLRLLLRTKAHDIDVSVPGKPTTK